MVPVAVIEEFLAHSIVIPLTNLTGDGFSKFFTLLVGRGSHSKVCFLRITLLEKGLILVIYQFMRDNYISNRFARSNL